MWIQHEFTWFTNEITAQRIRLRRNQRNSRARKQAYVRDLEERWSDCVKQGAQATVEMQMEARRVQEENRLLRAVLHRYGLDNQAIQLALEAEKQFSTVDGAAQPFIPSQSTNRVGTAWKGGTGQPGTDKTELAPSFQVGDISLGMWPSMADPAELLNMSPGPTVDKDMPQVLDLQDWLNDLCNIKDALTAEAYVSIHNDLL